LDEDLTTIALEKALATKGVVEILPLDILDDTLVGDEGHRVGVRVVPIQVDLRQGERDEEMSEGKEVT
jgi:hypothetical protein